MNIELAILWGLVGWASQSLSNPQQDPIGPYIRPEGDEGPYLSKQGRYGNLGIAPAVGGIVGGMIFINIWPIDLNAGNLAASVAASGLGAFLGGRITESFRFLIGNVLGRGRG